MHWSSIIWRGIAIILLCIMLQACSKEKAVENRSDGFAKQDVADADDGQQEAGRTETITSEDQFSASSDTKTKQGEGVLSSETADIDTEGVVFEQQFNEPSSLPLSEPHIPEKAYELPDGFVYLEDVLADAQYEIRYYSDYNFVGTQIEGYNAPYAIATKEMAESLTKVNDEMAAAGYRLLIYDTYRPAKAVEFFKAWSADQNDTVMKDVFYPNEDKSQLFKRGYLSKKSGHSRGSTVDLTLVESDSGALVDMGSPYDLLDEISYFGTKLITKEQAANREILKKVMKKHGFKEYSKEWWHYVLINEPYPTTYFNFDVQ